MAKKKQFADDDGRTVADMSGVSRQPMIAPRFSELKRDKKEPEKAEAPDDKPWEDVSLSKSERRSFTLGALSAALLIGGIFVVVFFILIYLISSL